MRRYIWTSQNLPHSLYCEVERDLSKRGLNHGDRVDVTVDDRINSGESKQRIMRGLTAVAFTIAEGSVAAYYPEANVLVALDHYDAKSGTPSYKSISVQIRASVS